MAPAAQLTSRDLSAANNVEPMPAPVSGFAQLGKVSLPRTGQRPLVFEGEEIARRQEIAGILERLQHAVDDHLVGQATSLGALAAIGAASTPCLG